MINYNMALRYELKFECVYGKLELIENKIKKIIDEDENAIILNNNKKGYKIHSLYFDDINNNCAYDNDAGVGRRHKFRIRYYNDDTNKLTIEKKKKCDGLCNKLSAKITLDEYKNIVTGRYMDVFWGTNNRLLKEICVELNNGIYKPTIIIDYDRSAYVDKTTKTRITFDRNISCSKEIDKFLTHNYTKCPIQEKNKHLLEVKFNGFLPNYVKKILESFNLVQSTFSKYYLSRHLIERN